MAWDYEDEFESREDARKERDIAIERQSKDTLIKQIQLENEADLMMGLEEYNPYENF